MAYLNSLWFICVEDFIQALSTQPHYSPPLSLVLALTIAYGYQEYTLSKYSTLQEIRVGVLTCFIISIVAGTLYIELRIYLGLALPWSWVMKFVVTRGGTRPFWFVTKMPDLLRWSSCITCIWKIKNLRALSLYGTFKSRFPRIQPLWCCWSMWQISELSLISTPEFLFTVLCPITWGTTRITVAGQLLWNVYYTKTFITQKYTCLKTFYFTSQITTPNLGFVTPNLQLLTKESQSSNSFKASFLFQMFFLITYKYPHSNTFQWNIPVQ